MGLCCWHAREHRSWPNGACQGAFIEKRRYSQAELTEPQADRLGEPTSPVAPLLTLKPGKAIGLSGEHQLVECFVEDFLRDRRGIVALKLLEDSADKPGAAVFFRCPDKAHELPSLPVAARPLTD